MSTPSPCCYACGTWIAHHELGAIAILTVMAYHGAELVHLSFSRGWSLRPSGPPLWIPYLSMPLGFGLFALQLLADLQRTSTPAEEIIVEGGGHYGSIIVGGHCCCRNHFYFVFGDFSC